MKINFTAPITDFDGNPVKEDGGETLTLSAVAQNALVATLVGPDGRPEVLDGKAKVRNATIAQTIHTKPADVDLTVEDVALIKERIGKAYGPLAVMRAWELLDPPAAE